MHDMIAPSNRTRFFGATACRGGYSSRATAARPIAEAEDAVAGRWVRATRCLFYSESRDGGGTGVKEGDCWVLRVVGGAEQPPVRSPAAGVVEGGGGL